METRHEFFREPPRDFGRKAREQELLRYARRRNLKRVALIVLPILIISVMILSFGPHIKNSLSTTSSASALSGGTGKKESKKNTVSGITILKRWELPEKLLEISGVTWMDEHRFVCVQDEMGIVFIYNVSESRIEKEIPFAGTGDYEGIALVGDTAWVVRSDGNLYEISSIRSNKPSIKEYDTPLTAKHDTEGLCYDPKNNRLLLAIKETEPGNTDFKGIYGFDLGTRKMMNEPIMRIDLNNAVFDAVTNTKKKAKPEDVIMPSDIAVHPATGDFYIIEGRKPKLLVTEGTKALTTLFELDKNEFLQPEGITFSPNGDMFISNEGVDKPGNILKVELVKE